MELLQKLKQLDENIKILENIKAEMLSDEILQNKRYEWELRYGLFESIQIVIDVSSKIANQYNLGNPGNYRECIELLGKFNYIRQNNTKKYTAMIGLRNLLIREYAEIDAKKLYDFLSSLDDFRDFIVDIKENI